MSHFNQYRPSGAGYRSPFHFRPPPGSLPLQLHVPTASNFPNLPDPRFEPRFHSSWQHEYSMESINAPALIPSSQPLRRPYPPHPFLHSYSGGGPPLLMSSSGASPLIGLHRSGVSGPHSEPSDPFIADWLQSVGERRSKVTHKGLVIPDARLLLSRAVYLVATLHSLHASLTTVAEEDCLTLEHVWKQVNQHKSELETIQGRLSSAGVMEHLVRKTERTKAKRERSKQGRRINKAQKKERMALAEEKTDSWLRERRQEELKLKMEESVQASAKSVLEEVNRKQDEIKQYQDLLTALNQLREHRKEFRKKGEVLPLDTDEIYMAKFQPLENMLSQQIHEYEGEEHTLRVLMKEEVREKMSCRQKQEELNRAVPPAVTDSPFSRIPLSLTDLMQPHREYWLQAEKSEDLKAVIRQRWSCFEHPEGTPGISEDESSAPLVCIPAWRQFLEHRT